MRREVYFFNPSVAPDTRPLKLHFKPTHAERRLQTCIDMPRYTISLQNCMRAKSTAIFIAKPFNVGKRQISVHRERNYILH